MSMSMGHKPLLNVRDTARKLAISEPSVGRLIRANQIAVVRIGRSTRISEHAVDWFIECRERLDCGAFPPETSDRFKARRTWLQKPSSDARR